MSLFKCLICPDFSTFTLYKHYVLEHFHLEAFKDLQKFFPNGYQDCSKCVTDYAHSTLKDAIIHIGVSHKRVDVYLKKYLRLRKIMLVRFLQLDTHHVRAGTESV